jgi:hypothetical protein
MNALTYPDGAQALRMSRQVLDGKLITVNQPQFAFGSSGGVTACCACQQPAEERCKNSVAVILFERG